MIEVLALPVGAVIGFAGSRRLRRPERAAQAASVARSVGGNLGRRKGLSAPELQRACFSEMVRHVRVDREGRSAAPARYLLKLHPDDLATVDDAGGPFDPMTTSYFLGRQKLIASKRPGMALWRERLFAWMTKSSENAMEFFRLPTNRVVELGSQMEI